jgi:hypothetical protein
LMEKKLFRIKKECVYFSIVKMNTIIKFLFQALSVLCVTSSIQSCSTKSEFSENKPKNLIEEEKMKKIMSKMMLLETAIQIKYPDAITSKKTIQISGIKLLKSFDEDSLSYRQSFDYYASNKEQMQEMYNEILEEYNISLSKLN